MKTTGDTSANPPLMSLYTFLHTHRLLVCRVLSIIVVIMLYEYLYTKWILQLGSVWRKFGTFADPPIYLFPSSLVMLLGFCLVCALWMAYVAQQLKDPVQIALLLIFLTGSAFILSCVAAGGVGFIS